MSVQRGQLTGRLCGTQPGSFWEFSGLSHLLQHVGSAFPLKSPGVMFYGAGALDPLTYTSGRAWPQPSATGLAGAFLSLSFLLCNMRIRIGPTSRTSHCPEGVLAYSHSPPKLSPRLSLEDLLAVFSGGPRWVCLEHRFPSLSVQHISELARGWKCAIEKEPAVCPHGFQGDSDMTAQTHGLPQLPFFCRTAPDSH